MDIVTPYPRDTRWTYRNRESSYTPTSTLALAWEVDGDPISDDYATDEISATDLWAQYKAKYWDEAYHGYPEGTRHIFWYVTGALDGSGYWEEGDDVDPAPFEGAPFQTLPPHPLYEGRNEDFLFHFTWPTHAETGERVNFLRLPVLDKAWNRTHGSKGGFIQEATGWKPSPLQPTVNLRQLEYAAGL